MPRFAVLRDLHDRATRPLALVTEHDDRILVHYAEDCGMRTVYAGAYNVMEPDGSIVTYRPGRSEFFDYVLMTLARAFAVDEVGEREHLGNDEIWQLYVEKVTRLRSAGQGVYVAEAPVFRRHRDPSPYTSAEDGAAAGSTHPNVAEAGFVLANAA